MAWLAVHEQQESVQRAYREAVEAFLRWSVTDNGPARGRRQRYERELARADSPLSAASRVALDRFAEHAAVVAGTLPVD